MIIPDANLLIYSHDSTAPQDAVARKWWEKLLSEDEAVGIPVVVILAFVRLMTHPALAECCSRHRRRHSAECSRCWRRLARAAT